MKLKNEAAIEALALIIDPAVEICNDDNVKNAFRADRKLEGIKFILKDHAKAVREIMARMEGVDPDEFECDMMTLPAKLIALFSDPDIAMLFPSQDQKTDATSFGTATEVTKVAEK